MEKKIKLLPPMMPNFISTEMPSGERQDGLNIERGKFSITDLTKEEAEEYGELMKQEFIKHWRFKVQQLNITKKSS